MVDIGDLDSVSELLKSEQVIRGVFITHSHFDHIYGLNDLVERYPNVKIYISADGAKGLFDDKKNFSLYHEASLNFQGGNVCVLQDGELANPIYSNGTYTCSNGTLKTINGAWIIKDSANSSYHYVAYETVNSLSGNITRLVFPFK